MSSWYWIESRNVGATLHNGQAIAKSIQRGFRTATLALWQAVQEQHVIGTEVPRYTIFSPWLNGSTSIDTAHIGKGSREKFKEYGVMKSPMANEDLGKKRNGWREDEIQQAVLQGKNKGTARPGAD